MKKRLFCILLALCLLAPLFPTIARAAEDLSPYVAVLEDAMKNDPDAEHFGEAMFFDLDDSAPRELILVRCPEDAAHAVLEVWTIRSGKAERILNTPLVVLVGGNTGSASVGEYNGKPVLVAESRSPEVGDTTITYTGGFKRFVMENGKVEIDESAFYTEVVDISPNAKEDPILYDKSDSIIQGVWHSYEDYLDWRHSTVLLATNAGYTGDDWDDDAEPFKTVRDYCATAFWDVPEGKWFTESVHWAVERGITTGTAPDQFSPNESCTRAQFVTFLWRAAGQPKAKTNSPFSDVPSTQYYYPSVSEGHAHARAGRHVPVASRRRAGDEGRHPVHGSEARRVLSQRRGLGQQHRRDHGRHGHDLPAERAVHQSAGGHVPDAGVETLMCMNDKTP